MQPLEPLAGMSPARLVFGFESLGEGFEFGFVQRRCGADPAGLFRFAHCPLPSLLRCLDTRFEGFARPENLEMVPAGDRSEGIRLRDRDFGIEYQTWVGENAADLPCYVRRLDFLRRKLVGELAAARKVFVWQPHRRAERGDARRLLDAMRAYGGATLLWVDETTQADRAGSAHLLAPGLVRGWLVRGCIDQGAPGAALTEAQLHAWLAMCLTARGLVERRDATPAWTSPRPVRLMAHVENRGDLWSDAEGWAGIQASRLRVQGFEVRAEEEFPPRALACQALLDDGTMSDPVPAGAFSGTRGVNRPLLGLAVSVTGEAAGALRVSCEASFVDGTIVGPVADGSMCEAESGAALEALRVLISVRS